MSHFIRLSLRPLKPRSIALVGAISTAMLVLSACSESTSQAPGGTESVPAKATAASVASSSGLDACLLKVKETPCDLITESVVRSVISSDAELSFQSVNLGAASCSVSWSAGRKAKFGNLELETDDNLQLSQIQQLNPDPVRAAASFAAATRQRTEAERQAMGDAAAKKVQENKGVSEESQQLAQEMARNMLNKLNYEPVSGVGDAAAWGGLGRFKQLMVLSGTVQFLVSANVSENDDENRQQATVLAQALLEACR